MADEPNVQDKPRPAAKPDTPSYDVAGWKERARSAFKVSPHAIAGALHELGPDDTATEDEVRKALKTFTEREHEHGGEAA